MSYEKEGVVSVWLGDVIETSREKFSERWLEEDFRDENSATYGMSSFMTVYETGWIDHDFQEFHFYDEVVPVETLIQHACFGESYREPLLAAAADLGFSDGNAMILVLDFEYPERVGKRLNKDMPMKFIGSFAYVQKFSDEFQAILDMKT